MDKKDESDSVPQRLRVVIETKNGCPDKEFFAVSITGTDYGPFIGDLLQFIETGRGGSELFNKYPQFTALLSRILREYSIKTFSNLGRPNPNTITFEIGA